MLTMLLGGVLLTGGLGLSLKHNWTQYKRNRSLTKQLQTCREQAAFRLTERRKLDAAGKKASELKRSLNRTEAETTEDSPPSHPPYTEADRDRLRDIIKNYLKAEKEAVR